MRAEWRVELHDRGVREEGLRHTLLLGSNVAFALPYTNLYVGYRSPGNLNAPASTPPRLCVA